MRIVVSLTTLPGREALVEGAIKSIQSQTRPADAIYLFLPREHFAGSRIHFHFEGVTTCLLPDIGPAMKLIPTLAREKDPRTLIITIDDDVEYPPKLIEKLLNASILYPKSAIGFTGWNVTRIKDEIPEIKHKNQDIPGCRIFESVQVLEGTRGVIYRRSFFDNDILTHASMHPSFRFHDDILFSGYLASRDIGRIVRWFDLFQGQSINNWKIHGLSDGLHTTENWYQHGWDCWSYWAKSGAYDMTQQPLTSSRPVRIAFIEEGFNIKLGELIPNIFQYLTIRGRYNPADWFSHLEEHAVDEIFIVGVTSSYFHDVINQIILNLQIITPGGLIQVINLCLEGSFCRPPQKLSEMDRPSSDCHGIIDDNHGIIQGYGDILLINIIDRCFDKMMERDTSRSTLTLVKKL
jgi:hypothetical protein